MLPCQGKVIQEMYTNCDYVTKITVTKYSVIAATLNKPDCPNSPSLPRLLRCDKELGCRFYGKQIMLWGDGKTTCVAVRGDHLS